MAVLLNGSLDRLQAAPELKTGELGLDSERGGFNEGGDHALRMSCRSFADGNALAASLNQKPFNQQPVNQQPANQQPVNQQPLPFPIPVEIDNQILLTLQSKKVQNIMGINSISRVVFKSIVCDWVSQMNIGTWQ